MDRLSIFAVTAAREAVESAGLTIGEHNGERIGVVVGTGVGPMEAMEDFARPVMLEGAQAANPAVFPNTVYNAAGGQVAMHLGAVGPASTVTSGHAAGAAALCYAHDLIAYGRADAVLAIAVDTLTDTVIRAYGELGLLAGDTPSATGGRGFALAEAGVALLLESETAARARGARIDAKILGHATTADAIALGRVDRGGRGIERAMRLAVERAGLTPGEIAAVWASTAGNPDADRGEAAAIRRVLGDRGGVVMPKLLLGEPMGAGGALSAALAITGWRRCADPAAPVLVNSCSLGGTNVSLVLTATPPRDLQAAL
jgi:3-oxoacyl-[acyl-carrier-protein] synthase II